MANQRTKARLEARIKARAAHCIEFELSDPRASFVTLTRVELSADLGTAHIHYSVLGRAGDRSRTAHMLQDATGFIRKQVARVLEMRRIPRLVWVYDDSVERQANLERTIAEALRHDREINPQAHPEVPAPGPPADDGPAEEDELKRDYADFLDAQDEEEGH
jgi:ribosome-binding factor A